VTLIAGLQTATGLILAADTEEVISAPPLLRSRGEKIHVLSDGTSDWKIIVAGAGSVDYIGMARDFIREKTAASAGEDTDIIRAIRESVHEIWRDFACYEQIPPDLKLLIGSWSNDHHHRFTVVNGSAVRDGRDLEAMGIGDATFRSLADRFLQHGRLSFVGGEIEAIRIFTVYAMQQAKETIPGVGGSTRIATLMGNGTIKYEKSFSVAEIEKFFYKVDGHLRLLLSDLPEPLRDIRTQLRTIAEGIAVDIESLRKNLKIIEESPIMQ